MRLRLGDIVYFFGFEFQVLRFQPGSPNLLLLVDQVTHELVVGTTHADDDGGPLTTVLRTTDLNEAYFWFDMEKGF